MNVDGAAYRQNMNDSIELFQSQDGTVSLEVRTDGETVWLTQQQLAALFGRDVTVVRRHISNARREELAGLSTSAKFALVQQEGSRTVERLVEHYNLDMILSVGYRVKSPEGVHFRKWATEALHGYLVEGIAINESRMRELGKIVSILSRSADELISGTARVIADYLPGLVLLRDYDEGQIEPQPRVRPGWRLSLEEAREVVAQVAAEFPSDNLFGNERGDALAGVIGAIYQGFAGHEIYPTVEEKAANLLYLVVKDHPLSDGNKRSGAALFVTFLAKNDALVDATGSPRISNNALAALTLLVAMSDPAEKRLMVALIIRMLTEESA